MKKMLVIYYSWSNGNTKRIAEQLANETGADIARIETTEAYKGSHEEVVDQGQREVEAGFMPQINPLSVDIADYDVIAIGTPTWWYTMAPAVLYRQVVTIRHPQVVMQQTIVLRPEAQKVVLRPQRMEKRLSYIIQQQVNRSVAGRRFCESQ